MKNSREKICFTVIENDNETQIETYENEYRNLMALLNNTIWLESFGECGGQGRCATCIVQLISNNNLLTEHLNRNEESTLIKAGVTENNKRLSCQIFITPLLNGVKIIL